MTSRDLFLGVTRGSISAIHDVLSRGVDINSKNHAGSTAVHLAALEKNEEIVRYLIGEGADVNQINNRGKTPLEFCIDMEDEHYPVEIIKMLVNAGASVNSRYRGDGTTALHMAAKFNNNDFVLFLLDHRANVNAEDYEGWTPLCYACQTFDGDSDTITNLLIAGANPNAVDHEGDTPLHILLDKNDLDATIGQIVHVFDLFSEYNANFRAQNRRGLTPMDVTLYKRILNTDLIEALILHGGGGVNHEYKPVPDEELMLDRVPVGGKRILHLACEKLNLPLIKFLLDKGADINLKDFSGATPFMYAVHSVNQLADMEVINYLIGCDDMDFNVVKNDGSHILKVNENLDFLWRTIIAFLAAKEAMGHEVIPTITQSIHEKPAYEIYYFNCVDELRHLKLIKSSSSFFSLLVENEEKLLAHAQNRDLVDDFYIINVAEAFPIYGKFIQDRFTNAIRWQVIFKRSAHILSSCLPGDLPPSHLAIKRILSFCDSKDLLTLCQQSL